MQQVVDWAIEAGLYVILNTYHGPDEKEKGNPSYEEVSPYLTAVWQQTAQHFKNHSEYLLFDVMNEPHGEGWRDEPEIIDLVNRLNTDALNVIRQSGGYNDRRIVLLPTAYAHVTKPVLEKYAFPADDPYCIASIHAYTPWWFCLGEEAVSYEMRNLGFDHTIFSPAAEQEIRDMFLLLKEIFIPRGIPFVMGEAGAVSNNACLSERLKWVNAYFTGAKNLGMPVCIHSDIGHYAQIDYPTLKWVDPEYLQAIFAAYGKSFDGLQLNPFKSPSNDNGYKHI